MTCRITQAFYESSSVIWNRLRRPSQLTNAMLFSNVLSVKTSPFHLSLRCPNEELKIEMVGEQSSDRLVELPPCRALTLTNASHSSLAKANSTGLNWHRQLTDTFENFRLDPRISSSNLDRLSTLVWIGSVFVDGVPIAIRLVGLPPLEHPSPRPVSAPTVLFWEPNLDGTSLMYRNAIPHTFPWDTDELSMMPSRYVRYRAFLKPGKWVRICWHYPGSVSDFQDIEWTIAEGPTAALKHSCEWLRAYLDWRPTGVWSYGGVDHTPTKEDLERQRHDYKTFRRDQMATSSAFALASRSTF